MKVVYELPDSVELVDSHGHLGDCILFDGHTEEPALLAARRKWGVATSILLPSPGVPDAVAVHDRIAKLAKEYPGEFYGVVSMNPLLGMDALEREARRCVEELGFVGIKLHPYGHGVSPWSPPGRQVFELAEALRVPVIVHTGVGIPNSLPAMLIPAAQAHPDTTVVLYHAGAYIVSLEAIVTAQQCPNVVLETSWCAVHHLRRFVDEVGPDRVMFGSDIIANLDTEIVKFLSSGLTEDELRACMGQTARQVFGLASPERPQPLAAPAALHTASE